MSAISQGLLSPIKFVRNASYLIILQRHEIVVDVLIASIFFDPCFKLLVVQNLTTVFQYKGVSAGGKK